MTVHFFIQFGPLSHFFPQFHKKILTISKNALVTQLMNNWVIVRRSWFHRFNCSAWFDFLEPNGWTILQWDGKFPPITFPQYPQLVDQSWHIRDFCRHYHSTRDFFSLLKNPVDIGGSNPWVWAGKYYISRVYDDNNYWFDTPLE